MKKILFVMLISYTILAQDNSWMLYDDSEVAQINITTTPETMDFLYNNVESDSLFLASVHFQNAYIFESIDSVGFRIRGNTSRFSAKKSFKLDFEHFVDGREFYGVDKMNLNGEHNDPSIIRSKLAWDFFNETGIVSSRAAHCRVYINGTYYGLYVSVEHYDKEFLKKNFDDPGGNLWKCLWGSDLTVFDDGYDPQYNGSSRFYLKTNTSENDFTKLTQFIYDINNLNNFQFPILMFEKMDLPGAIKIMAWDVLFGMWDDYWSNMNNYYLYHEPARDKFYFIPYDYDNIMGITWPWEEGWIDWANADIYDWPRFYAGPRPLADRILEDNQLRNLYTHFIRYYSENVFALELWDDKLDSLYNKIAGFAYQDSFRTWDYGFNNDDFNNSFSNSYDNMHIKRGIREYVNLRNQSIAQQAVYLNSDPILYEWSYAPLNPIAADSIKFEVSAFSPAGLMAIDLRYTVNGGELQVLPFNTAAITNSKKVEEADRWKVTMPPVPAGSHISWNVLATDNNSATRYLSPLEQLIIDIPETGSNDLLINEFMARNNTTIMDENEQFEDWIEIYNSGSQSIDLSGYYLSDNPANLAKWRFPDNSPVLEPQSFILIWCDEDQSQGLLHTNFKLAAAGEFIALLGPDGVTVLDSLSYSQQVPDISYGRIPDGSQSWQALTPTPGEINIIWNGLDDKKAMISDFHFEVFPNPFNNSIQIEYQLNRQSDITIRIFDILGRLVWNKQFQNQGAGRHNQHWDGKGEAGEYISSGQYIIQLTGSDFKELKRITLVK